MGMAAVAESALEVLEVVASDAPLYVRQRHRF